MNSESKIPLRALDRVLRETAESWWYLSFFFKLGIFVAGIFLVFTPTFSQSIPFVVAILTLTAEFALWRYSNARDTWEKLHRKLDFFESLGWAISNSEISDLLTEISRSQKKRASGLNLEEKSYFASNQNLGSKKAVMNVQESSWWAKHIAKRASAIYTGLVIILLIGSFFVLSVSIETVKNFDVLTNMGRAITSAVMLIFSLDLVRIARSYKKYSDQSASIEASAQILLNSKKIEMVDAIKLIQEYHLAHAEAPMNPQWLWKLMRDELNVIWREYRQS